MANRSLTTYRSVVPLCNDGSQKKGEFELLGTAPFIKTVGLRCSLDKHPQGDAPLSVKDFELLPAGFCLRFLQQAQQFLLDDSMYRVHTSGTGS